MSKALKSIRGDALAIAAGSSICCFNVMEVAAIEFSAKASAEIGYTDNANQSENKQSEGIASLSVGTSVFIQQQTADLELNYHIARNQYLSNKAQKQDEYFNTLDFSANKRSLNERVILRANATVENVSNSFITQPGIDIFNRNTVENRSAGAELSFQSEAKKDFQLSTDFETSLYSNEDNIGDHSLLGAKANLSNEQSSSPLLWTTDYQYNKTFYNSSSHESSTYSLEQRLGFSPVDNITTYIKFYYDAVKQNEFGTDDSYYSYGPSIKYRFNHDSYAELGYEFSSNSEAYWNGALVLNPSERTRLQFDFTRRFFGDAYTFLLSHKSKKLTNSINYQEKVSNFDREFFAGSEITDSYQILKSITWTSSLALKKSSFQFDLSYEQRTPLVFDALEDIEALKSNVNLNHRLSRNLSIATGYEFRRNKINYRFIENEKSLYRKYGLSFDYKIARNIKTSVAYDYIHASNYQENVLNMNLQVTLL